jgi:hypothetical protein
MNTTNLGIPVECDTNHPYVVNAHPHENGIYPGKYIQFMYLSPI